MKTIPLRELLKHLEYSDLRAVRTWCSKNNVFITKQGKNEFVFETNFKEVFELPFINKLKSKFGDEWESVYRLYSEGNVPALNMLQHATSSNHKIYKPENSIIQQYLTKYQSHGKKKAA